MAKIYDIFIPDLGADKDVDLIDIMVKVGDKVEVEDGLITLETEKASMDVPTTHAGIIKEILVKVGDKANSGDLIARVEALEENSNEEVKSEANISKKEEIKEEVVTQTPTQFVKEQSIQSVVEEVRVPDLGADKDVDLIDIMVKVGDIVEADHGLITLETEKASMDVPAPFGGEIIELFVEVGQKINSGDLIAKIIKTVVVENKVPTPAFQAPTTPTKIEKVTPTTPTLQEVAARSADIEEESKVLSKKATKVYASPSVRKIAREFGVDLGFVKGSAAKGRIVVEDIKAYVKEQLNKPASTTGVGFGFNLPESKEIDFSQFGKVQRVELSRVQKVSGPFLHKNYLSAPHVTQFDEADITELEEFRKEQNEKAKDFKLSPLVFIIKAVEKALKLHPKFNSSLSSDGQELIMKEYYNIGVAVDTPNGLLVPVIKDVDKKGFKEIAIELAQLSQKAREGKLTSNDMSGGCFTISSLGGIGGTYFTPIINSPEVAILGVSKSSIKPIFNGKKFKPRLMLPLSLSYDHKVIDGADGARFTTTLSQILSDLRLLSL
ncbi:dihydrolipoyllysine-residue acetyltransferase [Aliarcobacter skirrowii]|uniref:Dihydrolipoamide acetyltransferase component of pyruvate dehydrogenase complex n=1 Tax=Aliarcobacter skirrowii CCUG 10374 TaxID=1032239 RepID=A0AAD0WN66_9BACT|nr:dihydrolipoyllysine-residue acetyltransferase [Aliarcobacter skirrowii]AXX84554.1 pyruvate dehydrogenase multienzyme complex, E2 component dihydrolipoyl transacetylase [Aliarcobacter skirrowii CCUG 10374]KAB0621274.1 dihydrolipoyllysine-residue acetyltransferase [Aliarcobacter skirrowii CCUG 10374]RXI26530.1 dihydrolipoamide acetyltransferase [Aliarcobacter skirrowii CCUG 10374]SUV14713.1 Dihydrolipoyllysine-residue acetyltransferase component of pyruvate dehydrogenase complex [Aliarcobacter